MRWLPPSGGADVASAKTRLPLTRRRMYHSIVRRRGPHYVYTVSATRRLKNTPQPSRDGNAATAAAAEPARHAHARKPPEQPECCRLAHVRTLRQPLCKRQHWTAARPDMKRLSMHPPPVCRCIRFQLLPAVRMPMADGSHAS